MKKNRLAQWLAAIALLCAFVSSAIAAVGNTPGSASVSLDGSASYGIPIFAPPGTHGMTASLSLNYSSSAGSGWIGEGWFIGGLSSVHRCAKTWAQDGAPRNVMLDLNDRYCLDGNRLRAVSGTHGGAGTEYRTEMETFTRVYSQGSAGNGPAYFTAEMKNGLTYEFGNSTDSRIESQGVASRGAVAGDLNLIFQGSESITVPGSWFSATTYTFRRTNFPGVVTYTIDNPSLLELFERAIQHNNGKVPGLPWIPTRIPVLP